MDTGTIIGIAVAVIFVAGIAYKVIKSKKDKPSGTGGAGGTGGGSRPRSNLK